MNRLPQVLLVIAAFVLMLRTERFFTPATLTSILTQASIVGVLALGQAFVLVGGGFDLSQGAMMALTAAVTAHLAQHGVSPVVVAASALAIGALLGSINGVMVAAVRTNPFVTTLSTLLIFRGAAFITLSGQPIANIRAFQAIDSGFTLGSTLVPARGVLFLALTLVSWLVLRQTVFGQHIYALGERRGRPPGRHPNGPAAGGDVPAQRAGRGHGHDPLSFLAPRGQARHSDGLRAGLHRRLRRRRGLAPGRAGQRAGAAAGCLLLQALRTQITMSGFPEEYRTLVTGRRDPDLRRRRCACAAERARMRHIRLLDCRPGTCRVKWAKGQPGSCPRWGTS